MQESERRKQGYAWVENVKNKARRWGRDNGNERQVGTDQPESSLATGIRTH
jgi:hypothetical protein